MMKNKFIYSSTKSLFEKKLAAGEIGEGAIAFIEDTKEIWTRGQYFGTDMMETTYDDLTELIKLKALVPGRQYRIIDYVTTTTQSNTQSAGHQFDIIVTADSENTLSEVARAIQHEGDAYFADCDLNAWQLWYCLDNDTNRFAWADAENGKGVIYRMIDENNNDCPYDFKNILYVTNVGFEYVYRLENYQFGRNTSIDKEINGVQYYGWSSDNTPIRWSEPNCWTTVDVPATDMTLYKTDGSTVFPGGSISSINLDYSEKFTFNADSADASLSSSNQTYNNIIQPYFHNEQLRLNRITFGNNCYGNSFGAECYNNSFGNTCYSNSFGKDCYSNSFGNNCYGNSFGAECYNNSFGNTCCHNSFGNKCYSNSFGDTYRWNSFGNNCYSNSFGNGCNNNSFGNTCYSNSFGKDCYSNSFGDDCYSNSFGSYCYNNSFGNNCYYNSFGDDCQNNSFGNKYYSNSFGKDCYSNSFGNMCSNNSFGDYFEYNSFGSYCISNSFRVSADKTAALKNYVWYNHFDDGCSYNVIWNADTTSSSVQLKNINVNRGVVGKPSAYNMINITTLNSEQEINVNQVDGIVSIGEVLSINYETLKSLRDNSQLIPGRQYRIIDYVTTTTQSNTQSAGHQFDIIVTADDESILNEKARATQHEGDEYFANSNLAAWEIWYCLDNDTNRFHWADTTNGKGVIYRMIDEFDNDIPYDFKNILFKRSRIEAPEDWVKISGDDIITRIKNEMGSNITRLAKTHFEEDRTAFIWTAETVSRYWSADGLGVRVFSTISTEVKWFYTFTNNVSDLQDGSVVSKSFYKNVIKEGFNNVFLLVADYNIFDEARNNTIESSYSNCINKLNDSVLYRSNNIQCKKSNFSDFCECTNTNMEKCIIHRIFNVSNLTIKALEMGGCTSNIIENCKNIHITNSSCNLLLNCTNGNIGNSSAFNVLSRCERFHIGDDCAQNIISGVDFTIGNGCEQNLLDSHLINFSFGNQCKQNEISWGRDFEFGNNCNQNKVYNVLVYSKIGAEYCRNEMENIQFSNIGDNVLDNNGAALVRSTFKTGVSDCTFTTLVDCIIENNVKYVDISPETEGNSITNVTLHRGVLGAASERLAITIPTKPDNSIIEYGMNSNGELKHWIAADLVP